MQILSEKEVVASTMGSLHISISVGGLSRARFHRRLETPPTSVFKVKWSTFSAKLPFSAESGQEIEQSLKGFSESGII